MIRRVRHSCRRQNRFPGSSSLRDHQTNDAYARAPITHTRSFSTSRRQSPFKLPCVVRFGLPFARVLIRGIYRVCINQPHSHYTHMHINPEPTLRAWCLAHTFTLDVDLHWLCETTICLFVDIGRYGRHLTQPVLRRSKVWQWYFLYMCV